MIKICVFDLDGTLCKVNSHVDIIQQYTEKKKIEKLIEKVQAFFFPRYYLSYLNKKYASIPDDFVNQYVPEFRKSAMDILNQKRMDGYKVLCISSAPERIITRVGEQLGIEAFKAPIGKKDIVLSQRYPTWDLLTVVTDNVTDKSILEMSDEAYIFTKTRRQKQFMKMMIRGNIFFLDKDKE